VKIFPNAEQARNGSRNNVLVHGEIRHLETAILDAIDDGLLTVVITNSVMTLAGSNETPGSGRAYFTAWMADPQVADRSLIDQMNNILIYFKDLGYSIIRKPNGSNAVSFKWEIMW
jgi:hypothetical protein